MLARILSMTLACLCVSNLFCVAEAEKRYVEATYKHGELKYIKGIPVLKLEGSPEEIGEQFGELAMKPAKKPLLDRVDTYMKKCGYGSAYPVMLRAAGFLLPMFPENNQKEISAAAQVSGVPRNVLIMLNAMPDLEKIGGCSTVIVNPERSQSKTPLFGRLLDWPPYEDLPEFTLITVFKQPDKHTLATITFPVILGAISGMNDQGLCLAIDEINGSKDGSPKSDLKGTPMLMIFRKILEECSTVEEAEKLLKESKRTTYFCLTVCDKKGGRVLETTPKNVIPRLAIDHICCCTNHFRTDELSLSKKCFRYDKLEKIQKGINKLDVDGVAQALHTVNQGAFTVQSMVFQPAERKLHLAFGGGKSATAQKLTEIDLTALFKK